MPRSSQGEITRILSLLRAQGAGRVVTTNRLFERVYPELRRLAAALMRGERRAHTLEPTGLVNEAYLRMVGGADLEWQCRAHFFGIAASAMRQILVDHARRRSAAKRGGGLERVTLNSAILARDVSEVDVLDLDRALAELEAMDGRIARMIELRIFGGLKAREIACVQGVSESTVETDWRFAKSWLKKRLSEGSRG